MEIYKPSEGDLRFGRVILEELSRFSIRLRRDGGPPWDHAIKSLVLSDRAYLCLSFRADESERKDYGFHYQTDACKDGMHWFGMLVRNADRIPAADEIARLRREAKVDKTLISGLEAENERLRKNYTIAEFDPK